MSLTSTFPTTRAIGFLLSHTEYQALAIFFFFLFLTPSYLEARVMRYCILPLYTTVY